MRIISLIGWLLVVFAAAAVGGRAAPGQWYAELRKPSWNPPNWVFAPVWTILFTLMGVAAWMVWERRQEAPVGAALALFAIQLVLNMLWSWIFFGMHRPGLAFLELLVFFGAIAATTVAFWQVRPLAGWLFVPYLVWVAIAGALNFTLWRLNR